MQGLRFNDVIPPLLLSTVIVSLGQSGLRIFPLPAIFDLRLNAGLSTVLSQKPAEIFLGYLGGATCGCGCGDAPRATPASPTRTADNIDQEN